MRAKETNQVDPWYRCHTSTEKDDSHTEQTFPSPLSTTSSHYPLHSSAESACLYDVESPNESLLIGEIEGALSNDHLYEDDRIIDPSLSIFPSTPQRRIRRRDGHELYKTGLRASLDAGMTALRSWIRSRNTSASEQNEPCEENNTAILLPLESLGDFDITTDDWGDSPQARPPRHRTQSEPDASRLRLLQPPSVRRRRGRMRASTEDMPRSAQIISLSFSPHENNNTMTTEYHGQSTPGRSSIEMTSDTNMNNSMVNSGQGETSGAQGAIDQSRVSGTPARVSTSSLNSTDLPDSNDPERRARMRWIRINRRFQLVITFVALLFSLLLFAVLVCWVVLTSSYVVSFDKSCDVPLKPYFWLVTLQLVLDVFRSDIMRVVFSWDGTSNQRIPVRVVAYNIAYLIYAVLVLRLGINSVFIHRDNTCRETAPELYNASAAFISLSIAAWATIICGYLLPFCVVAALLTYNGYNPSSSQLSQAGTAQPVFPAAYSNTGAPSSCIEMLPIVPNELVASGDYPRECCICMEDFRRSDIVVETYCKHVFHKQCCREWLLQARSCPICRTDIPSHLNVPPEESSNTTNRSHNIPLGPTGRPVAGLLRILSHADSMASSGGIVVAPSPLRARTLSVTVQDTNTDVEEGFRSR